jgi:hypothetical protein
MLRAMERDAGGNAWAMFRLEWIGHCGEPSPEPPRPPKSACALTARRTAAPSAAFIRHVTPSMIVRRALGAGRTI